MGQATLMPCKWCGKDMHVLLTQENQCAECVSLLAVLRQKVDLARRMMDHIDNQNALIVRYNHNNPHFAVPVGDDVLQLRNYVQDFNELRRSIEAREVNIVILHGSAICTGWRLKVNRRVKFERCNYAALDARMCQNQAELRIVGANS